MGNFIRYEDQIAVEAERMRLHELAAEVGLPLDVVAANQVAVYRRSLHETREALADAVALAHV